MKKLLTTTALIFAAAAAPAAAAEAGLSADVSFDGQRAFSCTWTGVPEGEDCLAIVGDAQDEVRLLERHGAEQATITIDTGRWGTVRRTIERRDNGTWLLRGDSSQGRSWGFVCGGEPLKCAIWEGGTKKTIAKATKKVTKKA